MEALNRFFRRVNESPISTNESPKGKKREPLPPLERLPTSSAQGQPPAKRINVSPVENSSTNQPKPEINPKSALTADSEPLPEHRPLELDKSVVKNHRDIKGHLSRLSDELDVISKENQRITASTAMKKVATLEQKYRQLKNELQEIQQSFDSRYAAKRRNQPTSKNLITTECGSEKERAESLNRQVEALKKMLEVS